MGDISTWSPVDESNTAAPPNGWPEGQATNTVNNCGRAMQGAIRRFYDTVTAQLASLTASLANYLPLAGGTLTGPLSATSYQLGGVAFAQRDAATNFHSIYDADGVDGAVHLGGAASGYQSLYRAGTHYFQSNSGGATYAVYSAAGVALHGNVTADSNITALGDIAAATITGNHLQSNGNIDAAGDIGCNDLGATGSCTVGTNLAVSGGGNIVGTLTAGAFSANLMTAANLDAGDIDCTGNIDAASYTVGGAQMVMLTAQKLADIEARIDALERMRVPA